MLHLLCFWRHQHNTCACPQQTNPGPRCALLRCALQAALLARGRTVRQAKLFFFAKMAEKALASYERDGWGEFPTQVRGRGRGACQVP